MVPRTLAIVLLALAPATAAAQPRPIQIKTLSNRADLISDGQALVRIVLPKGTRARQLRATADERDVSSAFRRRADGHIEGVVSGLRLGANRIAAAAPGARGAQLTITDHPNGGPVFSGPQVQPWQCQQGAVDAQCDEAPQYTHLYRSTDPAKAGLQPYDPGNPPSDVATTTTDQGIDVPFIVRQELGYQYKILTLFTPGQAWSRWRPQHQWNHKVLVTAGDGCGADYHTGTAPLDDLSEALPSIPGNTPSYITALGRVADLPGREGRRHLRRSPDGVATALATASGRLSALR